MEEIVIKKGCTNGHLCLMWLAAPPLLSSPPTFLPVPAAIDACDANLPPINTNLQHPSVMISMSTGNLVPSKAPCPCNLKTNKSKH